MKRPNQKALTRFVVTILVIIAALAFVSLQGCNSSPEKKSETASEKECRNQPARIFTRPADYYAGCYRYNRFAQAWDNRYRFRQMELIQLEPWETAK